MGAFIQLSIIYRSLRLFPISIYLFNYIQAETFFGQGQVHVSYCMYIHYGIIDEKGLISAEVLEPGAEQWLPRSAYVLYVEVFFFSSFS